MIAIIVLGSPNFPDGTLGPIAMDRLKECLSIFDLKKHKILCTGGFGSHFNTSPMAHAHYLQKILIENGVPVNAILPLALSSNTVEDAIMSHSILKDDEFNELLIITSEYHVARVEFIFTEIFRDFKLNFHSVSHLGMNEILIPLIKHEKLAMDQLNSNGLYY